MANLFEIDPNGIPEFVVPDYFGKEGLSSPLVEDVTVQSPQKIVHSQVARTDQAEKLEDTTPEETPVSDRDPLRLAAPFVLAASVYTNPKILDFGSGDGERAAVLQQNFPGADVTPYDPMPLSGSPLAGMKLKDCRAKYDVIILSQVLHHVVTKDPVRWLIKLKSLLSPKGMIVVREDIWSGLLAQWNQLDYCHSKYHDHLGPVCFLTRPTLLSIFARAGLFYVPVEPPDNFPLFRARGYRGQVYHFTPDETKSFSRYQELMLKLTANATRLRHSMLNDERRPEKYRPLFDQAADSGPIPYACLDYIRDTTKPHAAQIHYVRKYGMERFATQALVTDPSRGKAPDDGSPWACKVYLLTVATLLHDGKSPTHGEVMKAISARTISNVVPVKKADGKLALAYLVHCDVLVHTEHGISPGPKYSAYLATYKR
jgi:hypothetical protein